MRENLDHTRRILRQANAPFWIHGHDVLGWHRFSSLGKATSPVKDTWTWDCILPKRHTVHKTPLLSDVPQKPKRRNRNCVSSSFIFLMKFVVKWGLPLTRSFTRWNTDFLGDSRVQVLSDWSRIPPGRISHYLFIMLNISLAWCPNLIQKDSLEDSMG